MQKYKYTAVNLENKKIKGTFIAKDERDLAEQLAKQSLYLTSASLYSGETPSAFWTLGTGTVTLDELANFCRQFAIMLTTSVPLLESIDVLRNQPFTSYFKSILDVIYDDVKGGMLLSEALEKHAKVFPDFFRSMIYVGEMSGKLDIVCNALADFYEKDQSNKQKLKSALSYPMMLMGLTVVIAIVMLVFIVPIFKDALSDLDVEIIGITKVIYDMSDFVLQWWRVILVCIIMVIFLIYMFVRTETGKYAVDVALVSIPLLKGIQIPSQTTRFARAFALLLTSGMDLTEAMEAVSVVLTNRHMRKQFQVAIEYVRHGMSLTNSFDSIGIFPTMLTKMVAIGERTNSLNDVLTRSCSYFDMQLDASFNSFSSKIQPIMLAIMAAVIGSMFIAVYSPMLSIMTSLS